MLKHVVSALFALCAGGCLRFDPASGPENAERCCERGGDLLGTCLPAELLEVEQAESLPVDSCSRAEARCVPTEALPFESGLVAWNASWFARSQQSPGLCIPECFISPLAVLLLPRERCANHRRCVPCSLADGLGAGCP